MYQYNRNGKRWYYDQGKWYASVTEFVKNSRPMSPHLIKWMKDNSAQDIDHTLATTAEYGTKLHALIEDLLLYETLDVSQIEDERLLRHLTSINQFFVDYEVQPIHVEKRVKWDASEELPLDIAGTVDLVAQTNKGLAVIDFKSGNIYDAHKYQMMCYALALGETEAQFINVRPKEWRTKPTYEAKVWNVTNHDWSVLQAMGMVYEFQPPKAHLEVDSLHFNQPPTYQLIDPEQWIQNQQEKETDFVI